MHRQGQGPCPLRVRREGLASPPPTPRTPAASSSSAPAPCRATPMMATPWPPRSPRPSASPASRSSAPMSIAATAATTPTRHRVFVSGQKRGITPTIRRELRRRNAIEPRDRPHEGDGHLDRNFLLGTDGDAINVVLAAAGHNLRLLRAWLARLFALLLASSERCSRLPSPSSRNPDPRENRVARTGQAAPSGSVGGKAPQHHEILHIATYRFDGAGAGADHDVAMHRPGPADFGKAHRPVRQWRRRAVGAKEVAGSRPPVLRRVREEWGAARGRDGASEQSVDVAGVPVRCRQVALGEAGAARGRGDESGRPGGKGIDAHIFGPQAPPRPPGWPAPRRPHPASQHRTARLMRQRWRSAGRRAGARRRTRRGQPSSIPSGGRGAPASRRYRVAAPQASRPLRCRPEPAIRPAPHGRAARQCRFPAAVRGAPCRPRRRAAAGG